MVETVGILELAVVQAARAEKAAVEVELEGSAEAGRVA